MNFYIKGIMFNLESISWGIFDLCNGNIYIYLIKCIFDGFYVILKLNQLLVKFDQHQQLYTANVAQKLHLTWHYALENQDLILVILVA